MTTNENGGGVADYLASWNLLYEMHPDVRRLPKDWKYRDLHALVLDAGRSYTPVELPDGIVRGEMKECFMNAARAVMDDPTLTYVEGFAAGIIPVHHAWVTDDGHRALDVTWDDGADYHGIAFDTDWLMARLVETGVYGVFGDVMVPEWLEYGLPVAAIAD